MDAPRKLQKRHCRHAITIFVGLLPTLCLLAWCAGAGGHGECLAAVQHREPVPQAARTPASLPSAARARVLRARTLALYYYYDALGLDSLAAHSHDMTLLGPQCFSVDAEGIVRGAVPKEAAEIAERARLPVMPLVVNPGFDRATVGVLLHSAQASERAATYLAYLAKRDHFVGFQLDLENIDPSDQDLFTRFATRVAARLHAQGRLLSVAVVPRFSDTFPGRSRSGDFPTGSWGAAYDHRALGRIADFIVLMAYDQHSRAGPPGPIAGHDWVEEALGYTTRYVPREKLVLGIPLFGREWSESGQGVTARGLTFQSTTALLGQFRTSARWDERWRSPWFEVHDGPAHRTVWFEDERSLRDKMHLVQKYHLRGFAAWRLGFEDPRFWALTAGTDLHRPARLRAVRRDRRPRGSAPATRRQKSGDRQESE